MAFTLADIDAFIAALQDDPQLRDRVRNEFDGDVIVEQGRRLATQLGVIVLHAHELSGV